MRFSIRKTLISNTELNVRKQFMKLSVCSLVSKVGKPYTLRINAFEMWCCKRMLKVM